MSKETPQKSDSAGKKDGDDLTTILDESQRADLTLLIANATQSMRKLLTDNFEATAGLDKSLLNRESMTEDEKLMSADPASTDVQKLDRERKLKEEYEKNLATLKMKNLKKNSLKAFDEWRESVIMRVGQVVNSERVARDQLTKESEAKTSHPQAPNTIGTITDVPAINIKFKDLFPPIKTPLTKLSMQKRTLILHSILLLLLSLEHYTAPSRILLLNLTSSLKLPLKTFEQDEYTTAKGLLESAKELTAYEETKKKAEENKETRKWRVGLATAAGAALIGVTGSLAAPMIAAGVGSVMGGIGLGTTAAAGYLGAVAGNTLLVGSLFGAYGGRMTGQMMDNYAREVEDFEFLPVHSRNKTSEDQKEGAEQASDHDHKLRVTICISGWLTEKDEVVKPWRVLGKAAEVFALKYELESLLNLGNAINGMVQSAAWGYAQKEMIAQTIFADLAAAMWPIGLMKVSRVIDNPFSVAKGRAEKAGEVLADALINKAQGERPVTLIGYSLGARVIYTCLMSLAKRKAFGLVESVVMIGSPTPSDTADWRILRSVVSGRLINVYSENDYILGFMYRTSSIQYGVAGLQKVEGLAGVENVDVSEDVKGHLKYRYLIGSILKKTGFEDIDMGAVEEEHKALVKMEKEEKKQSLQSQRKRLLRRESYKGEVDEAAEAEHEASEIEKKVQASTQKSLTTRVIEYFYMPNTPNAKVAQEIANDPSQAVTSARKTVSDMQSYAQWAAGKLPSMPGMRGKSTGASVQKTATDPSKAAGQAGNTTTDVTASAQEAAGDPTKAAGQLGKTATGAGASTQSYTRYAAGYLPSMPTSMPSMPKSLPSMPNMPKMPSISSQSKKSAVLADTAKKAADSGQDAVKTGAGVAKDVVQPTLTNVAQPQKNPAVKAAHDTAKKAPVIQQASDKVASVTPGSKSSKADNQSYVSKASSYLPNMPSMPSFGGSVAKKPDAEAKPAAPVRSTSDLKKQTPKLDRVPSGVKSPVPKLDRVPSGIKSLPPKLDRVLSGLNSPPPKLERLPSGLKSPPAKLERLPSGMKSPPTKLDQVPSGLKSSPAKAAKQVTDNSQNVLKESGNAANEAAWMVSKDLSGFGK